MKIHTLGFPRIGAQRELKFALERHWKGESAADVLPQVGERPAGPSLADSTQRRTRLRDGRATFSLVRPHARYGRDARCRTCKRFGFEPGSRYARAATGTSSWPVATTRKARWR